MSELKVGHRSSEDEKWQEVKKACRMRDKGRCRCCNIMTPAELAERNKLGMPSYIYTPCDVAHIEAVGGHVEKTYDLDNVVFLCRSCHSHLDTYESPVTGKPISEKEHEEWWNRIRGNTIPSEDTSISQGSTSVIDYLDVGIQKERFDPNKWLDS